MQNEFYSVSFNDGNEFFFKKRDNAFKFLWQYFLSHSGECDDLNAVYEEMNELAMIKGYGYINTYGFEDFD